MPTNSDTPCNSKSTSPHYSVSTGTSPRLLAGIAVGGGIIGDFLRDTLGDLVDFIDLVGLLIFVYGFAYPPYSAWATDLAPIIAGLARSIF